jgi:hypothetical protein
MVTSTQPGWMNLPPIPASPPKQGGFLPVNVTAQIVETRKPNTIAGWLGSTAADKKADLVKLVEDKTLYALSPDTRNAEKTTATTEAETASKAYTDAYTAAKKAYADYTAAKATGDAVAISQTANAARITYKAFENAEYAAKAKMKAAGIQFTLITGLSKV